MQTTETWEERRAREQAECKKLIERLEAIAKLMKLIPKKEKEQDYFRACLRTEQGIFFSANDYGSKGRVHISAYFREIPREKNPRSINISLSKDNERIAQEAKKRFMDDFREALALNEEANNKINKAKQARENLINKLGEIVNIKPYNPNNGSGSYIKLHEYFDNKQLRMLDISTDYQGKEAKFEFDCSPELAAKICSLLKNYAIKEAIHE